MLMIILYSQYDGGSPRSALWGSFPSIEESIEKNTFQWTRGMLSLSSKVQAFSCTAQEFLQVSKDSLAKLPPWAYSLVLVSFSQIGQMRGGDDGVAFSGDH